MNPFHRSGRCFAVTNSSIPWSHSSSVSSAAKLASRPYVVQPPTPSSGFTAGHTPNPTYEQVSSGGTGHTEAVQVTYDPAKVSYETLLKTFWHNVDAVDAGGQFCDRGSQYRSGIYVHSPAQQQQAEASKTQIAAQLGKSVATEIVAVGPFYKAEGYHQDYYKKNPARYKFYKWNCGRAQRLEALWGKKE